MKVALIVVIGFLISLNVSADNNRDQDLHRDVAKVQSEMTSVFSQGGSYAVLQHKNKNKVSPFGVGLQKDGSTIVFDIPEIEKNKKLSFRERILSIKQLIHEAAMSGKINAGAMFVSAIVPQGDKDVKGLAIEMEHKSGLSILRFAPYEIMDNGQLQFQTATDQIKPIVFFKDVSN